MLGPLRVEVDDGVTAPRGARSRDLLAVLVARRGRAIAAESLLDLVWGEAALGLTVAALHTAVARLRRQVGADVIGSSDLGYLVPAEVESDADEFGRLVAEAASTPDRDARIAHLRAALALWRTDDPYAGVSDHLLVTERLRLAELRRRSSADLVEALLDRAEDDGGGDGDGAEVTEAADLALGLWRSQPLDESAAALAMRTAYRRSGQGAALEIHEELRRTLRDELGVRPGPTVRDLHARVLAQDPVLDGRDSATAIAPVALHPGRLVPVPASATIGREAEVQSVLDELAAGRRLVTIVGPGGVGKSRLLAEIGAALIGKGEVTHVSLGAHAALPADELAASVAVAVGVPLHEGDPVAGLVAAMRSSKGTVLADEAEWSLSGAAELASAILAGCPSVRLAVTSRVPLGVTGERVMTLEPLPVGDPSASVDERRTSAAVRLLHERLGDRGDLPQDLDGVPEDDLRTIAEVAARLDGLPLALEVVAGAAAGEPLAALPHLADAALDVTSDSQGRDDRHRSLRDALAWGVGRLGADARVAFRRLGVFAGPFTVAAASAVVGGDVGDPAACVRMLARHNLLRVERSSGTVSFRMLRVVRDLALDELAIAGEVADTTHRHRRWFADVWRDQPLSDELVEHVGRTHDDHVDALTDALHVGDDVAAADIALTLCRRWQFVEASAVGSRWVSRVLAGDGVTDQQRARLEICRAGFRQGADWDAAHHDRMRRVLRGDHEWTAMLALVGAITAYVTGDVASAYRHLDEGRAVAATGTGLLPEVIATRAVVDAAAGDVEAAVAGAREALAHTGVTRSAVHSVTVVPKVALAYLDAGRPREALELLTSAAADAEARFGILPTTVMTINAGWAALAIGEAATALSWFVQSLTGPQAATAEASVGEAASGAGCALATLGGADDASELLALGASLLARAGQALPPTFAAHVDRARGHVTPTPAPSGWASDLLVSRVVDLVTQASPRPTG